LPPARTPARDSAHEEDTMTDSFKTAVLDRISDHLGTRIKAPQREGIEWSYVEDDDHREIQLALTTEQLSGAFRSEGASSPVLALCLAAALDGIDGAPARVSVTVTGKMPALPKWGAKHSKELLQYRKSAFLLSSLAELLPDRFHITVPDDAAWAWPKVTWFGIEGYRKNKGRPDKGKARLAYEVECRPDLHAAFCEGMEPIRRFQGLLPISVFETEVSKETPWTHGGKNGVDVWVASADDRRLHLFEFGEGARGSVVSLTTALYNLAMLVHVSGKHGHFDREAIGLVAIRRARRVAMWLSSDQYNPLVFDQDSGDSTVLSWLNRALRGQSFQFGVLPWSGDVTAPQFQFDGRWGGGFR
jgi:hypothetical protein